MKRLILLTTLLLSFGTLRAATSTLANAQVLIDPATGLLLSIPTSGSVAPGPTSGVSITAGVAGISVTAQIGGIAAGVSFTVVGNGSYGSDNDTPETNLTATESYNMVWNPASVNGTDRMRGDTRGNWVHSPYGLQVLPYLGITNTAGVSTILTSSITFTATAAAANGVTIVAAVAGKTIAVIGYGISTDTAGKIVLHHQGAGAVRSNAGISNIVGGGRFASNGGEVQMFFTAKPGLAVNQPLCADFSAAMTDVEVLVTYFTY